MGVEIRTLAVEAKLDGTNWTDITADVIISAGVRLGYGISGHGPMDRMAGSGQLTFSLDNSASNSGGLAGYYTPGHTNARSGFELNLPVRVRIEAGELYSVPLFGSGELWGSNKVKFIGKVSNISVVPGTSRIRRTAVTCQDFIWEMTKHKMDLLATQENVLSGTIFANIISNMTESPEATSYDTGQETFLHGADDLKDEKSTALAAAQKVVMSEFGYGYVKGDGTLVFEDRHSRINSSPLYTLSGTDVVIQPIERGFDLVFNVIKAVSYPRSVGTSPEILYTLQREIEIKAGATESFTARYSDPSARSTRIGGKDMVSPVIDTDYKFGSSQGGGANDKNADLDVSVTFGSNAADVSLTNTSGAVGYVNLFKLRGTALRLYDPIEVERTDSTSIAAYGSRELTMQFPYQENHLVVTDFADLTLANYRNPQFVIPSAGVIGKDGTRLSAAVKLEPGDRITLSDDIGGINNDYFVHSVSFDFRGNGVVQAVWSLVVAAAGQSWLLGVEDFSELGVTTILGV